MLEVMRRYGYNVGDTDVAVYATEVVAAAIAGEIKNGHWLALDAPEPGCAVAMALDTNAPQRVQHLGVYLGGQRFIHILQKRGVLVSRIDDRVFSGKIRGYYRWIG